MRDDAVNDDAGTRPGAAGPPSLGTTASLAIWGHLWWLAYVFAGALVVLGVAMVVAGVRDATIDDSIWDQIGVGIVRWFVFAAGVTTLSSYMPMFLGNGVTRGQLAASSTVAMVAISLVGAVVVVVGYLVERIVYPRAGWELVLRNSETQIDAGTIASRALAMALVFAAYFVSGWLVGIGFYRYGSDGGIPLIVPSVIPLLVVDVTLGGPTNLIGAISLLERWMEPVAGLTLPVAAPVGVVVVAAAAVAAHRATVATPLRT